MGSESPPKLPVIEFSKKTLQPGTSTWLSTRNDVLHALEEFGCFEAVYDEVSSELNDSVFQVLEELFDLPTETKKQNTSNTPYFGYIGQEASAPLYESMGIDNPATLGGTQSFTNLMWPNGHDRFCESMLLYSKTVTELDQMVRRMVFESYGVEKYYDSNIGSIIYILRLMKYGTPQMNESNIGVHNHTDKSFITILHQNQVKGLEIKTKDGKWISFEPSPSSFVVMAGDGFLAWSNDRIHSPNHRVTLSGNKERYSLGLFSFSSKVVDIPEELVDDEHPLRFKSFDHLGLLNFYFTDEHKEECSARAYCGI